MRQQHQDSTGFLLLFILVSALVSMFAAYTARCAINAAPQCSLNCVHCGGPGSYAVSPLSMDMPLTFLDPEGLFLNWRVVQG